MSVSKSRIWMFLTIGLASVIAAGFIPIARAAQAADALLGVEAIEDTLPVFDGGQVRDPRPGEEFPPLRALVSRGRYWQQDRHMEVVARLAPPEGVDLAESRLSVRLTGSEGRELSRFDISPPPSEQFVFYPGLPNGHLGDARIEIAWLAGGRTLGERSAPFRIERFEETAPRSGRIRLDVPNADGATLGNMPVTVGVPFPRGALEGGENLRLVDEDGREIPLQVDERARWSKFGTVKWVLCDFTADLDGGPRTLHLEYGPEVRRAAREPLAAGESEGFPFVDAGRLRFGDGLWFDARGDGEYAKVLEEAALAGAFVEHEDARVYRMAPGAPYVVEEEGPEKIVLRREGWYREEDSGREFCKHVTRYVVHRDSPVVRIFHTWIFTGDGNRDRIANMGWRFDLAGGMEPGGFLTSFGEDGRWTSGDYLLQWDYDHFDLVSDGGTSEHPGGRAPGVAMAESDGVRLYFGAKDFWQNYPSELEFHDGALWFHNWPRHGRTERYVYDPGQLNEVEFNRAVVGARFAHEGAALDFRLPDVLAEDPVWSAMSQRRPRAEADWYKHEPETANAQGVSRTEEVWLYLSAADSDQANEERVLEGLNEERLRAFPDTAWIAKSGAFYEMHHQDWEKYPESERIFELMALAPFHWIEWLEFYGMWNYGDFPLWGGLREAPSLYRARRKRHHGWPISWAPFARSGDSRLLKLAEASTRQMVDANFCHYVGEDVKRRLEPDQERFVGHWARASLPWVGKFSGPSMRNYDLNVDYNLHAYYLTGYQRSKDNLRTWAEQVKRIGARGRRGFDDGVPEGPRGHRAGAQLKEWVEYYEATFDPWFLVAAHAMAESHYNIHYSQGSWGQSTYTSADREFVRFSGLPKFEEAYRAYRDFFADPRSAHNRAVEPAGYGWVLDKDDFSLGRVADWVDFLSQAVYEGDSPAKARGTYLYGHTRVIFHGYALDYFPMALGILERAGGTPEPIGTVFGLMSSRHATVPEIALRKEQARPLLFAIQHLTDTGGSETAVYELTGPDDEIVMSGETTVRRGQPILQDNEKFQVSADAPAGDYRLRIDRGDDSRHQFDVPVSDIGTLEVMVIDAGDEMPGSRDAGRFWFMVPEGVDEFWIDLQVQPHGPRMSVWNADGERVWDMNHHPLEYDGPDTVRAEINVPPDQAGRLWRLTLAGLRSRGFRMDPRIPPVYATEKARWFMPESLGQ